MQKSGCSHRAGLNADSVFLRSFDRSTEGRNRLKLGSVTFLKILSDNLDDQMIRENRSNLMTTVLTLTMVLIENSPSSTAGLLNVHIVEQPGVKL